METPCVNGLEDLTIFGLVNIEGSGWNLHLLSELFLFEDFNCIAHIPLSMFSRLINRFGILQVTKCIPLNPFYHFLMQLDESLIQFIISDLWKKVWNLHLPLKVKNFFGSL